MPIHNADIADVFDEIADLLEILGENPFRVRAYRNAARTIRDLSVDIPTLLEKGEDLTRLPGIGQDLAGKIMDIVQTGTTPLLEELHQKVPPALTQLLKIPGLGPKRVKTLYETLHIQTLDELYRAAKEGKIRNLPGFGEKTELNILQALELHTGETRRFLLATADQYARALVDYLKATPGVDRVVVAGSYRRFKETVGDLDILVTVKGESPVMERFVAYDEVDEIVSKGPTRSTVILRNDLQVDVRVVADESFGAALHYFTGSKAHNIAIRRLGQARGLKINEYGVFKGEARIAGETEDSVFASVGLPFIPPELRENWGEIEAAQAGLLPKLVEQGAIRGDLHVHTKATDGHNTIEEMALAARAMGLEYIAIADHSKRLTVAKGLDSTRLLRQMEAIDRINERLEGITILKGIEVDILKDGGLDLPDEVLGKLDLVIGAVHSHFDLPRLQQTKRIQKAMDHPHFSILAHPMGRLIFERPPMELDMLRIIRHARERGCFLELNAHPNRLDLPDTYCKLAREEGVLISINTDAHSTLDFNNLRFGVGQARRGWLEQKDVLNARPLKELLPLLRRTMQ